MAGYKVRLGDGSEIGPMDLEALKTWKLQGLVDGDSPVMPPGSRKWIPLSRLPEFKGARGRGPSHRPRKGASTSRSTAPAGADEEPTSADHWRVQVVAGLLAVLAVGLGLLAWRPYVVLPAFDGAPWLQIALGALALGLALLPGRQLGRRVVRALLLLAAFCLFPLGGILAAQGERGAALLTLASAWVLLSGLVALLAPSLGWLGVVLAALPVVAGASGAVYFGRAPESETAKLVRSWTTPERRFTDDTIGLTLDLPDGWVALRPGNPVVAAPEGALVTIAQPRLEGYGYLVAEPAPWGVATPDQYLDHLMSRRRLERPSIEEQERANALLGTLAGRRLDAVWTDVDVPQRDLTVAGQDGWMSFALVAWMPEATASRPAGLAPLAGALSVRGLLAPRLSAAVEAAVQQVPHLTRPVAEALMAQTEARVLEPDQAFRRSVVALAELLPSLSPAETRELSRLTRATYQGVPRQSRRRLAGYIERVRRSATTDPSLDQEMAELMRAAELRLPADQLRRLQEFYERAVRDVPPSG